MPLMTSHLNIETQMAQINARSAQVQATLEAAKYRLHATQSVFMGFQENYTKASQDMLDQQMKMTEIQSALTELTQKNMGLQEAKIVLERCMMLIVKVKSSIMNLCRFFRAMSLTIEAIVKHSVQPFLENIAAGSSDDQAAKIGIYTFTDLQRTMLYHSALTIKANFSVFGDIAAMWCELSEKYIMPGVHMFDQLSLHEPDEHKRQRRVQDLQTWTERSTEGVKLIADKSQREIIESMERRVEAIQSVTKQLPSSAPMKAAIDAGMQESRKSAAESIVEASARGDLDRFVPKRK